MVNSSYVSSGCTPDDNELNSICFKGTPPTFSSDIQRIHKIKDFNERKDYALNSFDKMEDADMESEDYYDVMTYDDAHANSLVESPETQAYLSKVNLCVIVSSGGAFWHRPRCYR